MDKIRRIPLHNDSHQDQEATPRLLVVDDQPLNIEILKSSLEDLYLIHTANSGEAALDIVHKIQPDLVLLDIILGGISGIEVCQRLKEDSLTADIPVIFITSLEGETDENMCWQAGCADFIVKPFSITTLRNRIHAQLTIKLHADYLKKLACLDGLTRLYNRRFFDQQYDRCLKQQTRECVELSMLMVDVDHFKKFNDTYGHLAGDDCLRWIASVLRHQARRPRDFVSRLGGEEFCILLFDTDQTGAINVAHAIIEAVRNKVIPDDCVDMADFIRNKIGMTSVSIGIANRAHTAPYNGSEFMEMADQALYQAKRSGRDRYCIFEEHLKQ